MLFQKFLLLGLPVLALAASTTTEEDEDQVSTTTKSTSTSGFKTSTATTSSSSSKVTDDEEEEEEEEEEKKVTVTTTSKGAKVTTVIDASDVKNSTTKNGNWEFDAFGEFITELPDCTRICFETPIMTNVTENCAKQDNWNCVCHFYKPSFYAKVFNDTLPVTTTTKSSSPRKTATTTTEEPEATETEAPMTAEEIAQDEFFTCLDDACGLRKWGAGREKFFDSIDALNTYCNTYEKTYDEARNKKDYADIKAAEEALAKKKKAEEEAKKKKSDAGKLGMGVWAVTAVAGLTIAFGL